MYKYMYSIISCISYLDITWVFFYSFVTLIINSPWNKDACLNCRRISYAITSEIWVTILSIDYYYWVIFFTESFRLILSLDLGNEILLRFRNNIFIKASNQIMGTPSTIGTLLQLNYGYHLGLQLNYGYLRSTLQLNYGWYFLYCANSLMS